MLVVRDPVDAALLKEYAKAWFGDMVKIVVDVKRGILALGGELHADGEEPLLRDGSKQSDLWGANVYIFREEADRLEYTALINIRPGQGNRSMVVQDQQVRSRMKQIVDRVLPVVAP
ncbi:MAG: hypothetical protein HY717_24280 [Planctomycetes bacterium]|nr:hypothetical protein [Planctomycetota bacterium]